ncbi:MAG: PmoA family protein [Thermoproteota archaeon]
MLKIRVEAGPHRRINTPIRMKLKGGFPNSGPFVLVNEKGGEIPVQILKFGEEVELCWIIDFLGRFESKNFSLIKEESFPGVENTRLELKEREEQTVFLFDSQTVMSCRHSKELSKPFIYPLKGPEGTPLTWNSPPDHAHHRSFWTAHGMVNGEDLWLEGLDRGKMVVDNISRQAGYVFSEIKLKMTWQGSSGKKLVDEDRIIRLWNIPDRQWLIDYSTFLTANYGDVLFGDTKEAGMISIRVRESMEVENGGRIENSWGGINEAETWGRKANWCDYSGPVDGFWQGIAIFDHPSNPRHPSYWHVRDYGLMAANVFGVTEFNGSDYEKGGLLLQNEKTLGFCYRIYVHNGDAQDGMVSEKYLDYVVPPKVSIAME